MNREEMEGAISGVYADCLNCGQKGMKFLRHDKEYDSINNKWYPTKIYDCPKCGSIHVHAGYMIRYIKEEMPRDIDVSGSIPWRRWNLSHQEG
jgi:uncharacterized Zn finger protein